MNFVKAFFFFYLSNKLEQSHEFFFCKFYCWRTRRTSERYTTEHQCGLLYNFQKLTQERPRDHLHVPFGEQYWVVKSSLNDIEFSADISLLIKQKIVRVRFLKIERRKETTFPLFFRFLVSLVHDSRSVFDTASSNVEREDVILEMVGGDICTLETSSTIPEARLFEINL